MERETQIATAKVATLWSTVGIAEGLSHIGINDWGRRCNVCCYI